MRFGYNTNGFAHHRLPDAISILADLGYGSVAITLDYHALNPYSSALPKEISQLGEQLNKLDMKCVIETGARFLLDPRRKHQPTLLSKDRDARFQRLDFLYSAINIASELDADAVSFWSGQPDYKADRSEHVRTLIDGCKLLCEYATDKNVRLAFEPEPGMLIDTMPRFAELHAAVDHPHFGLTLDVGHLHCLGELPIAPHIHRWQDCLWNIHIEDMKAGVHDHLMFGEGEMDFPPIFRALRDIDYQFGVHVELSRHSHNAVVVAEEALVFMQRKIGR